MAKTIKPSVPLGDAQGTDLATGEITFDDDGHVEAQWLMALAEGNLAEELQDDVHAHLASCERCRMVAVELGLDATIRHDSQARTVDALPSVDLVGQKVGEYEILEKLSAGGMGFVYRGVQPMIGKPVAIKVLQPQVAQDVDNAHRLLSEARAVNAIRHPNIVDVFAFGLLPDGRQYFVMELLSGQSLSTLIRSAPMELIDALTVLEQAMSALAAAHAAGVVHRDLKPSNIFVTPLADGLHVTVLDFGVAKGTSQQLGGAVTAPGAIIGTPGYMSPEQIRGADVGPPSDIYSMGCVAFLLLTRRLVFDAEADIDLLRMHMETPAPRLGTLVAVPGILAELVDSMLLKDAALRPTAAEVRRRLSRLRKDLTPGAAQQRVRRTDRTPLDSIAQPPRASPVPELTPRDSPIPHSGAAPAPTERNEIPADPVASPTQRDMPALSSTPPEGQQGSRRPVPLVVALSLVALGIALLTALVLRGF